MKPSQVLMPFEISSDDWDFVEDLLDAVRREEEKEDFVAAFYTWNSAVRILRKIEDGFAENKPPTQSDLKNHSILLHMLIATGQALELMYQKLDPSAKKLLNFSASDLAAYVEDLKISLNEWHAEIDPKRLKCLQANLLSGA